jgi:hypothetical protein
VLTLVEKLGLSLVSHFGILFLINYSNEVSLTTALRSNCLLLVFKIWFYAVNLKLCSINFFKLIIRIVFCLDWPRGVVGKVFPFFGDLPEAVVFVGDRVGDLYCTFNCILRKLSKFKLINTISRSLSSLLLFKLLVYSSEFFFGN